MMAFSLHFGCIRIVLESEHRSLTTTLNNREENLVITLSNGHQFEFMVASGALAFDGYGWPWERPLAWAGLIKPHLFTVVIKSLTLKPRRGNLRWWKPWSCVRLLPNGSAVNKVGLTNPGIDWWCKKIGPKVDQKKLALVGSIFGDTDELVECAKCLNDYDLVGLELNPSCPNTGHDFETTDAIVRGGEAVKKVSRHPIIVKLSVAQNYMETAKYLQGIAEAISLNSVPWEIVFPPDRTCVKNPLHRLVKKVGGGGGGVSGKLAQRHNWKAVEDLWMYSIPVIAPSIMEYEDIPRTKVLGAQAWSFGAIHLRTPWKPTSIVERYRAERSKILEQTEGATNGSYFDSKTR
ncbi:hypothetical protein KW783_01770 [Candidatus Parcubacteria bacterium]|nr:hypothetical protein [Candidatus Parcubacteria bacterium]